MLEPGPDQASAPAPLPERTTSRRATAEPASRPTSHGDSAQRTRRTLLMALLCVASLALLWLGDGGALGGESVDAAAPVAEAVHVSAPEGSASGSADGAVGDAPAQAVWRAVKAPVDHMRRTLLGPPRVGIQIGHLDAGAHPDELSRLRMSTGGYANGVSEVDINRAVAEELAALLLRSGVEAELLPATLPPHYRADVLVSIHADSSPDPARRGYKSAHFQPARNRFEGDLKSAIDRAYLGATLIPDDDINVSGNMLHYYAFNRRYRHSAHPATPAVLLELGYISNRSDLALLRDPALPARAIGAGVLEFLRDRGRLAAPSLAERDR